MQIPTLVLLTGISLAVSDLHQGESTNSVADATGVLGNVLSTTSRQTDTIRHTRSVTLFLQAWARLVRTTLGFKWVQFASGGKGKTFVKVGNTDDAIEDFFLLGPTAVKRVRNEYTGLAGNQALKLEIPGPSNDVPVPVLYVVGKRVKTVVYAQTREQGRMALSQLPLNIPTDHSKHTLH